MVQSSQPQEVQDGLSDIQIPQRTAQKDGDNQRREQARRHEVEIQEYETSLGPLHPSTLQAIYDLGVLYDELGKVADAERLFSRASKGYEEACGPKDTSTLNALEYLGITYRKMGKLEEAETTLLCVVDARKEMSGPDDPTTLVAMNRLGMVYRAQGRLNEAESIYRTVWEAFDKTLGPENESTLRACVSLGNLAFGRGNLSQAGEIYTTALDRYKKVLGLNHPSSQQVASNLAAVRIKQESYPEAETTLVELIQEIEKGPGLKNVRALPPLLNLSCAYASQGKHTEAKETLTTALEGCEEIYGPNHTRTVDIMKRLAGVLEQEGSLIEAEEILQKALLSSSNACRRDEAAIDAMIALARVLKQQGKFAQAQQIHQQLYEASEAKFGAGSDVTIRSLHEVGERLLDQKRLIEAEGVFIKCTQLWEDAFGAQDERTLFSLMCRCFAASGLQNNLHLQGVESHILQLFERFDTIPWLQNIRAGLPFHELSKEYMQRGKIKDAEPLAAKAHEIAREVLGRGDDITILFGLTLDKARRQLWQQHQGLPLEDTVPLTRDATSDSLLRNTEIILVRILEHPSHPSPAKQLGWLGKLYLDKWASGGDSRDLESAIDKCETAILVGEEDDPERPEWLMVLGRSYRRRSGIHDTVEDLRKSIEVMEAALELKIEADATRAEYLDTLSETLVDLHERESELESLNRAIQVGKEALSLIPLHHPRKGFHLDRQGLAHSLRYQHSGDPQDLEIAFEHVETALALIPKTEARWSALCAVYSDLFRFRFQHSGEVQDVEQAVEHARTALHQGSQDNPVFLECAARQLEYRYVALGNIEDLHQSIVFAERAVQTCEPDNRYRAEYLARLGHLLLDRFEATEHQEDLDLGITHLEKGRDTPKTNVAAEARCFGGLETAFRLRYERTGDEASLEAAIHNGRRALSLLPGSFVRKVDVMNNLALDLTERFRLKKVVSDIDEATEYAEMVLSLRSPSHMYYAGNLNNLANITEARFDVSGGMDDLNLAIERGEEALAATHPDHPGYAGYSFNLGAKYFARFEKRQGQQESDLLTAVEKFIKGWKANGPPFDRVKAGSQAIYRLRDLGRLEEATVIAMEVVDLLPQVASRSLSITDQQYIVRKFSGIAGNACSLLLSAGRLQEAVEYLERGRTVILSLLMGSRTDISDLKSTYPEHASRFQELQDEINRTFHRVGLGADERQALIQRRLASVSEFSKCIDAIRLLPGQDRFLLGPTIEMIKSKAGSGFIIVVNITRLRSDAIIISATRAESIELSGLSYAKTAEWLEKDLTRKSKTRAGRKLQNDQYTELLHWLWESGVKPIFDHLKLQHAPKTLPRVCWIACGMASLLPFHAASDRASNSRGNTSSYAISSYSSSIQTMFQARAKSRDSALGAHPGLLMVGMPTTPGHASLSGVEAEISDIKQITSPSFSVQTLLHPQPAQVMSKLPSCDLVHFACHAVANPKSPLSSHLLLLEGAPDTSPTPSNQSGQLTVETILKADLKRARIAYLSACSTAENKAERLLDEAIHLASSFQVAGFAHVLGTMWPAPDSVSRDVAVGFYQYLASLLSGSAPDSDYGRAVAEAFHLAVNDIRTEWLDQPLFWAQFVHFGG